MTKKILVLTSTFPRWKEDTTPPFVLDLCKQLTQTGFDITVLAPHADKAKTYELFEGVKVYRFRYAPSIFETLAYDGGILCNLRKNILNYLLVPFFILFQLLSTWKIVKKEGIDTIHAHWIVPQGLIAALYKKLLNKKIRIVMTAHGSDLLGLKGGLITAIKKFSLNNSDQITAVGEGLKEAVHQLNASAKVSVIPMGIDLSKFSPQSSSSAIREQYKANGRLLIYAGRLAEEKGIRALINIMPDIFRRFPNTKLLILGEGNLGGEIRGFIAKHQLEDQMIMTGHIPHDRLPQYFSEADIFIGPSLYEGFGLAFIEALACGCAVIASDVAGMNSILSDGNLGLTVKPGNEEDLKEKISKLLSDDQLLNQMKNAPRGSLDVFDFTKVGQKYAHILGH